MILHERIPLTPVSSLNVKRTAIAAYFNIITKRLVGLNIYLKLVIAIMIRIGYKRSNNM